MVGASNFVFTETGSVSSRFKGDRKINHVNIKLTSSDLYDVITFGNFYSVDYKHQEPLTGLYFNQLTEVFETKTGLYLTL